MVWTGLLRYKAVPIALVPTTFSDHSSPFRKFNSSTFSIISLSPITSIMYPSLSAKNKANPDPRTKL